jgi:hypothetical protein
MRMAEWTREERKEQEKILDKVLQQVNGDSRNGSATNRQLTSHPSLELDRLCLKDDSLSTTLGSL